MMSKTLAMAMGLCAATLLIAAVALAGTYDFEDGGDGLVVTSPDPSMVFVPTGVGNWVYGDWRTQSYWGPYPDGPYYSYGNFFAWLGPNQSEGRINFPNHVTDFQLRYSSADELTLTAYNQLGIVIQEVTGDPSLNVANMGTLTVSVPEIAFVKVVGAFPGFGNYWIIDNVSTTSCETDEDCDDGIFCNGVETCNDGFCEDGDTSDLCPDDGLVCNGEEFCDETLDECSHQNALECPDDGLFCNGQEVCDELADGCIHVNEPDCPDDGLWCNGVEFCDENNDACGTTGYPCDENEECNEEEDICETDDLNPPGQGDEIPEIPDENFRGGGCGCA